MVDLAQKVIGIEAGRIGNAEFLGERRKQGRARIEVGIRQVGGHPTVVKRSRNSRWHNSVLPADLAGDLDEAFAAVECQQQGIQRFLMTLPGQR